MCIKEAIIEYVNDQLQFSLDITNISTAYTMPFGKYCPSILLCLSHQEVRDNLLNAFRQHRNPYPAATDPFITENFPPHTRQAHKQLAHFQQEAINKGQKATFRNDKLLIEDRELMFAMFIGLPDDYDHIMSQFIGLDDLQFTSTNMQEILTIEYEHRLFKKAESEPKNTESADDELLFTKNQKSN
ncbi:hypothetical protein CHUAL_010511 [Chamberlinius hualienensis]